MAVGVAAGGRAEWLVADLACIGRGHVVVPLATSDKLDRLEHIAGQCELAAVVCSPELVPTYLELAAACPGLSLIVAMTPLAGEAPPDIPDTPAPAPVAVARFADLERAGREAGEPTLARRDGGDLYTVLYTSGSTGLPKGAMRSYDAFNALVSSYGTTQPCTHLSFQPLSHLSERMMLPTAIRHGGQIAFASGDASRLFDEVSLVRPTAFGGVPRVFEVLRGQYEAAVARRRRDDPDLTAEQAAAELLPRFRAIFGDRLQVVSIGSAKPSAAVLAFLRACFRDCWVSEGYGSTEVGTIAIDGVIQADVDVVLIDVPELGYLSTDDPPRGEIAVRTPYMISGYVGQEPDRFAPDGYFRTGDIGERGPDGRIAIIGRRSNVTKLAQGEFVAPEEIEAALFGCPLIDQIFVYASGEQACVVAVVVPNRAALDAHLDGEQRSAEDALVEALRETGRQARLPPYEIPAAVFVEPEPMTAESGLLTSSNKPDRRAIERRYAPQLAGLYETLASASAIDAVGDIAASLVGDVDLSTPLDRVGVDSLASIQLVCMLEERLRRPVSMDVWFASSSLEDLARRLDAGGEPVSDQARADLERPLPFDAVGSGAAAAYETILVTGATGFLGRGLVESLLSRTGAAIVCLVRAPGARAARARLRAHLEAGGVPWRDDWDARLRVLAGDLAAPGLGLEPRDLDELSASVDAVLHGGAQVNWITAYSQLRAANVTGTDEIIGIAAARGAPLHFVSTISCAPADGDETTALDESVALRASGYGVSKWVAETRVRRAAERGLPVAIYRPAMISGHSERGHANPGDFGSRYLAGCVALGRHLDLDARLDMTPVDYVADGIVALSRSLDALGHTHHLVNIDQSMSYRRLGEAMRAAGAEVRAASYGAFREALLENARGDGDNPLAPLLAYFPASGFHLAMGPWPSAATRERLAALEISCPPVDDRLIATYLAALAADSEKV